MNHFVLVKFYDLLQINCLLSVQFLLEAWFGSVVTNEMATTASVSIT